VALRNIHQFCAVRIGSLMVALLGWEAICNDHAQPLGMTT